MTEAWVPLNWLRTLKAPTHGEVLSGSPGRELPHHIWASLLLGNSSHHPLGFKIALICFNQISLKQVLSGRLSQRPHCLHLPPPGLCSAGYQPRRATSSVTREQLLSPSTLRDVESLRVSRSSFRLPPTHLFQERLSISRAGR